jgi:PAS domain S-box-containing protein
MSKWYKISLSQNPNSNTQLPDLNSSDGFNAIISSTSFEEGFSYKVQNPKIILALIVTKNSQFNAVFKEKGVLHISTPPLADEIFEAIISSHISLLEEYTIKEEALNDSQVNEHRYRNLVENLPEVVFELDLQGRIIYANKTAFEVFQWSKEELANGLSGLQMVAPQDRQRAGESIREIMLSGEIGISEYLTMRKDGTTIPSLFHSQRCMLDGLVTGTHGVILDISTLKKAQQKLESQERRYRELFQNSSTGIFTANRDGAIITINSKGKHILGFSQDMPNDDRFLSSNALIESGIHSSFKKCMESSQRILGEGYLEAANGEPRYIHYELNPTHGENNQVMGVLGNLVDVTEMKKLQDQRLQRSEDRFMAVFNQASDGICLSNHQGVIISWNKAMEKHTGIVASKGEGRVIWKVIEPLKPSNPSLLQDLQSMYSTAEGIDKAFANTPQIRGSSHYLMEMGERKLLSHMIFPVTIANETFIASFFRDITAEKEAEVALKASEERFRGLTQNLPETIFETYLDGKLKYVNPAGIKMFGYEQENITNGLNVFDMIAKDQMETVLKNLTKMSTTGKDIGINEYIGVKKDNTTFPVLIHTRPVIENGQCTGFRGFVIDISERVESEQKLKKSKAIAEKLAIKAKAANMAKTEFLANMSHEIRTPMNGIIKFTDLVLGTRLTENQTEYMHAIRQSSNILMALINDILDFSKIEAGKIQIDKTPFELIPFLKDTVNIITPQIQRKGVRLFVDIDKSLPHTIIGDQIRIRQIILNLLNNAQKFTEKGHILFKVAMESKEDQLAEFIFSVTDTGIGVNKSQMDIIFQAFTQADSSITRRYGGTGLGLSISHSLVKQMGGDITVSSEPKKGSTFAFSLPLAFENSQSRIKPMDMIGPVLVMDNNPVSRAALLRTLGNMGVKNISALPIKQGEQKLESGELFNALFLSCTESPQSAIQTIENLQKNRNPAQPLVPIVICMDGFTHSETVCNFNNLQIFGNLFFPLWNDNLHSLLVKLNDSSTSGRINLNTNSIIETAVLSPKEKPFTVLLGEDNRINMLLTERMVSTSFPNATILKAYDGLKVIDLFMENSVDIILMDIQMPKMTGREATTTIRGIEKFGCYTPIIAVTAGTLKEEKEKCLASGMDDYLSKPIERSALVAILTKWVD